MKRSLIKKTAKTMKYTVGGTVGACVSIFALALVFKFTCYLLLGFWAFTISMFGGDYKERYSYEFEIESMKDSNAYIVSRYSGNSELRYYFLRETNGEIRTGYTKARNSSIIEDGENKVEVYILVPKFGEKVYMKLVDLASIGDGEFYEKRYVYHIPEDSVKREYNIDLE